MRAADGSLALWLMNGTRVLSGQSLGNPGAEWQVAGLGDFNGDGRSDIVMRHAPVAGADASEVRLLTMNGATVLANDSLGLVGNDWHLV